ncbi:MAG: hypothetical protein RR244_04560 [Oscillospiraceae bacterium]
MSDVKWRHKPSRRQKSSERMNAAAGSEISQKTTVERDAEMAFERDGVTRYSLTAAQ